MSGDFTSGALASLARKLVEEVLVARRCAEGVRKLMRSGLGVFLRWASRRGQGDL